MTFEIVPAHDIPLARQAEVFNDAFAGYVAGSVTFDLPGFTGLLAIQGLDLAFSRLLCVQGEPAGFGYINRTGDVSRLAGMGVLPQARGQGGASRLLACLIEDARDRGERLMTLEVFEQNPTALALYRRQGFEERGRLFGWRRDATAPTLPDPGIVADDIPLLTVAHAPNALEYPDLPWQVSRHATAHAPTGARAFAHGDAAILISQPATDPIRILTLVPGAHDPPGWTRLRALVATVVRRNPDRRWHAPAIFPESYGTEVLEPLGFTREPLNQFFMVKAL